MNWFSDIIYVESFLSTYIFEKCQTHIGTMKLLLPSLLKNQAKGKGQALVEKYKLLCLCTRFESVKMNYAANLCSNAETSYNSFRGQRIVKSDL